MRKEYNKQDISIYGSNDNLRKLLDHLERMGIDNDSHWNNEQLKGNHPNTNDYGSPFILLHEFSTNATIFTLKYHASHTKKLTYTGSNTKDILKQVKDLITRAKDVPEIKEKPKLMMNGYEVEITSNSNNMTTEHTELLKVFLKEKGTNTNVLFQDNIDNKRIDLSVWYEKSDDNVHIAGDEGELYEFKELDLIDERIIPKTS